MALQYNTTTRNAIAETIDDAIDTGAGAGLIVIYSGTKPADCSTALSGNTQLAKLVCTDPSKSTVSGGVLTLASIADDTNTVQGTASFFRIYSSADGSTVSDPTNCVIQGDVGTSGSDLNLNSLSIQSAGTLTISGSWTFTAPGA